MTRAFISYSWDSEEHKAWVRRLAERLRSDGIEATLDQWSTVPGDSLPLFMEEAIRDNPYVIIVCTPRYKRKSDQRDGGTGYEGDIMTGEIFVRKNRRKFIPILRAGGWAEAAPSWLLGTYFVDLRGQQWTEGLPLLVDTLHKRLPEPPPVQAQGFVVLREGDVLDNNTGLVWTNCRSNKLVTYEDLHSLLERTCQTTGYKWRLPSEEEVEQVASVEEYYPRSPIMVKLEATHPVLGAYKKSAWTPTIVAGVGRARGAYAPLSGMGQLLGVDPYHLASEANVIGKQFPARFVRASNEEDRQSANKL